MPIVKLNIKPGFDAQSTQTANESGWFSGNLVRWRLGLLEKIAGWARLFNQQLTAHVRSMNAWLDLANNKLLLMAGDGNVSLLTNDTITSPQLVGLSDTTQNLTYSVNSGTSNVTAVTALTTLQPGMNLIFQM